MILSDDGIRQALKDGQIEITPAPAKEQYTTSAVDMILGDSFKVWDLQKLIRTPGIKVELDLSQQKFITTAAEFALDAERQKDGSVILAPYHVEPQVMLCQTREILKLHPNSKLAARVEGRSSLARLGVMVHLTAPTIHAGFSGNITLEVINHGPFYLRLVPNKTVVCQFIFERLEQDPASAIATSFQNQANPLGTPSKN